jgi:hypothetical protein
MVCFENCGCIIPQAETDMKKYWTQEEHSRFKREKLNWLWIEVGVSGKES